MVKRFKITGQVGGYDTPLKKILDKQCVDKNDEERAHRKGVARSLYASDYGQCMRKTYFQFFPEKYPTISFDPRIIRIFQNGDSVHERLSEYLRREKHIEFLEEIDIPRDELDVHGRCDGLCLINDQFVVVEFKSINRSNVVVAKEEHLGQITWYMTMWDQYRKELRKLLGLGEDEVPSADFDINHLKKLTQEERMLVCSQGPIKGEIIMESKQTQEIFSFPVSLDEDRVRTVRKWFETMKYHVENQLVPENRNQKDKFPCSWGRTPRTSGSCAYWQTCWGEK